MLTNTPANAQGVIGLIATAGQSGYQAPGSGGRVLPQDENAIQASIASLIAALASGTSSASSVANSTSLPAQPQPDGALVFVVSQRSWYRSVAGAWQRLPVADPSWLARTTWEVATAGTADATGLPGAPITMAELRARLYVGERAPIFGLVTITITDAVYATGIVFHATLMGPTAQLVIQGTRTATSTAAFTAFTNRAAATNTPNQGTNGTENWTTAVGRLIVDTQAGANQNAAAWVVKDQGAGVGRLSSFMFFDPASTFVAPAEKTPAGTDTYTINTITQVTGPIDISVDGGFYFAAGSGKAILQNLDFASSGGLPTGSILFQGVAGYIHCCIFSATGQLNTQGCFAYSNCLRAAGATWFPLPGGPSGAQSIYGGATLGGTLSLSQMSGPLFIRNGMLFQFTTGSASFISLTAGGTLYISDAGFFDGIAGPLVSVSEVSRCMLFGTVSMWGANPTANTFALSAANASSILNQSGTPWSSTVVVTTNLATLQLDNSTTAMPIDATTWVDVAPARSLTLANLDLATGAAGFGQRVLNKRGGSSFNRTGLV